MIEIERFLAGHPPFSGLRPEVIRRLAGTLQVEYFPADTEVVVEGGEPSAFFYMIRRGRVELRDGGVPVDLLGEGELFGFPSLLSGSSPQFTVAVVEDALCYVFDRSVASEVFSAPSGLRFLTRSLRDRHASALPQAWEGVVGTVAPAADPLWVEPTATIAEAARAMTGAGASAVLLRDGDGRIGIVTDRDIRVRAVVAGRSLDDPVEAIASLPARTVAADMLVDEALFQMLDLGVHHLPVLEGDRVVAVVTDLDLLGMERRDAFRLRSGIQRARSESEVAEAGSQIRSTVAALVDAGADVDYVSRVVAILGDAMTMRLLELGVARLGPPPVPFAWLALGSSARREQCLDPHQDHAVVHADGADVDEYFARLAAVVEEGLDAAGVPPCPAKVLATEPAWRGSLSEWRDRLAALIADPETHEPAVMGTAFDWRVVSGGLEVGPVFEEAVAAAASDPSFLRAMRRAAVRTKVPIGFLGNVVVRGAGERAEQLDVERGGLIPLTDIARVFALEAGVTAASTTVRVRSAAEAGVVDPDEADALLEAFRVFRRVRLTNQVWEHRAGRAVDPLVDPERLDSGDRAALRDAFRVVREVRSELVDRPLRGPFRR